MALDPSIITGTVPVKFNQPDPINQFSKGLQLKGMLMQNQQAQQAFNDDQSSRQAFQQSGGDMGKYLQALASGGNYKNYQQAQAQELARQQGQATLDKTRADTGDLNAKAKKTLTDNQAAQIAQHRDMLSNVNTPQDAAAWIQQGVQTGIFTPEMAQAGMAKIQATGGNPQAFNQWKQEAALGATKYIEQNKPTYQTRNLGGTTDTVALPGLGGAPATVSSVKNTVSPDAVLQANTSRTNTAANIAKDYAVAGMTPGGGVSPDMETTAKAIASGQLPAPTGMALLNPKNQRVLARVMEINPDYDSTSVDAKRKAARDFSTGNQGNAMRSFAVAGSHLDQLGQLVDGLDNGNNQTVNKVGNAISTWNGGPAVTDFNAAKDVVSKEVIKAIVGSGAGGVAEREELAKSMASANSPAQLKGVITQYRNLMSAQHDALLTQRRAAGLPDSTMPDYSPTEAAANIPKLSPGTIFQSLPDPATLNGRSIQGPDGKKLKSNGKSWVAQ